MPNYRTIATRFINDAIEDFNRPPGGRTLWSLHTGIWERLRMYAARSAERWKHTTGISESGAIVHEYKLRFFDPDGNGTHWEDRENMVVNTGAVMGYVRDGVAALLEKHDYFKEQFVTNAKQVTFRNELTTFTGSIQVTSGAYDTFDGELQGTDTVLGIFSTHPIAFVPPAQTGNRGLKNKNTFIEVSTGAQVRLCGKPKGVFGTNGYAILFNELKRGH